MGDGNLKQQGLGPLGKSPTDFNPTHLHVKVNLRLQDKLNVEASPNACFPCANNVGF